MSEGRKNYLITSLSVIDKKYFPTTEMIQNLHELEKEQAREKTEKMAGVREYRFDKDIYYGIQSNEANCKAILKKTKIDTMIILATKSVYQDSLLRFKPGDKKKTVNFSEIKDVKESEILDKHCTLDYFLYEMRYFCTNALNEENRIEKIQIQTIPDDATKEQLENVATAIVQFEWDANCGLYVDSQGGMRDYMIVLIGILRLARQRGIQPSQILYTLFIGDNPQNEIVDKKDSYRIFDAVSGIDEFMRFGRVHELINFFQNGRGDDDEGWQKEPIKPVLEAVQKMSEAFSICSAEQMVSAVENVVGQLENFDAKKCRGEGKTIPGLQSYIADTIKRDMGEGLIKESDNIVYLIEWCYKKDFIQQAMTLYVDKLPEWYSEKKIFNDRKIILTYATEISTGNNKDIISEWFYTGLFGILDRCSWVKKAIRDYCYKYKSDLKKLKNNISELTNQLKGEKTKVSEENCQKNM